MVVIVYDVRPPAVLPFMPIELARVGYANLADRGMTLAEIWPTMLSLIGFNLVILAVTILYFSKKKEFV